MSAKREREHWEGGTDLIPPGQCAFLYLTEPRSFSAIRPHARQHIRHGAMGMKVTCSPKTDPCR